jgi:transcriptional regulator with XRE-family HTH domain
MDTTAYTPTDRIRQERRRQFLTMEQLATRSGVHAQTIWRLENGHGATAPTIQKIAKALNVDPSELVKL